MENQYDTTIFDRELAFTTNLVDFVQLFSKGGQLKYSWRSPQWLREGLKIGGRG
jgi:hypothetical protein